MPYADLQLFGTRHLDMAAAGMYFYFKGASSYNCSSVFKRVIFYEYHSEAKAFLVYKFCLLIKPYLLSKY